MSNIILPEKMNEISQEIVNAQLKIVELQKKMKEDLAKLKLIGFESPLVRKIALELAKDGVKDVGDQPYRKYNDEISKRCADLEKGDSSDLDKNLNEPHHEDGDNLPQDQVNVPAF